MKTTVEAAAAAAAREALARRIRSCNRLAEARRLHESMLAATGGGGIERYLANLVVQMYGRCGSVDEAERCFDAIARPNAISFSILMAAYATNGRDWDAKLVFDRMPQRDVVAWNALLALLAADVSQAERCFAKMPGHGIWSWNTLLDSMARAGDAPAVTAAFSAMPDRDTVSWNTLLAAVVNAGQPSVNAKYIFDAMAASRSVVSWTSLVQAYGNSGQAQAAAAAFARMPQWNAVTGNAMIAAFGSAGELEAAKRVLGKMPETDEVSWTALLHAYASHGLVNECEDLFDSMPRRNMVSWSTMLGCWSTARTDEGRADAKRCFDLMPLHWLLPCNALLATVGSAAAATTMFDWMPQRDSVTWNTLVVVRGQHGGGDEAAKLLRLLPAWNLVPWNSVMASYVAEGDMEQARSVFAEAPHRDAVAWTVMVQGFAASGDLLRARAMFDAAANERDGVGWRVMIQAYASNGELEQAWLLFLRPGSCRSHGVWAAMLQGVAEAGDVAGSAAIFSRMPARSVACAAAMVTACAAAGDLELAKSFFDKAEHRDEVSWSAMLVAYAIDATRGHLRRAKETFDKMPQWGDFASSAMSGALAKAGRASEAQRLAAETGGTSPVTWNALMAGCGGDRVEAAVASLHQMALQGVAADEISFTTVLSACSHTGLLEEARALFRLMLVDHGVQVNKEHYCCLVDVLGRLGQIDEAEDLMSAMPFVPNEIAWGCFQSACASQRDEQRVAIAAANAMAIGQRDASPYSLLANLYST